MRFTKAVLLVVIAANTLVGAQTTRRPAANPGGSAPVANATVNAAPQSGLIRILTPVAGQKIGTNVVDVRFELISPAADAGSPNFLVQLDGSDPVRTAVSQHTFTGLTPGIHSVTITLVDANDTPINGGRATVEFAVAPPVPPPTGAASRKAASQAVADTHLPSELRMDGEMSRAGLPGGTSPLPLISLIGFGVLVGGIASAMRTRG